MRVIAAVLSLLLFAPPKPKLNDPFGPEPVEQPDSESAGSGPDSESTLDCMLDDDCGAVSEPSHGAPPPPTLLSTAEELKIEARALVAAGKLREAIAILEQAYQLAPGDHIIAYEIA
jgi:hypothetical protein